MGEAHVTTRLQSQVQSHEEKIESISSQLKEMSKLLTELPTSMEKTMARMLKDHLKPTRRSPERVTVEDVDDEENSEYEDPGQDNPPIPKPKQPPSDDSLFSLPKVKLPTFEGTDARAWVSKAELYFQVHKTPTDQKLKLSQMCMDGSALHWFTNLLIRHPNTTWEQFRLKLLNRFSG
ncbi:hypothetical protein LXL04_014280 [Taraxacum kok-saghyz]